MQVFQRYRQVLQSYMQVFQKYMQVLQRYMQVLQRYMQVFQRYMQVLQKYMQVLQRYNYASTMFPYFFHLCQGEWGIDHGTPLKLSAFRLNLAMIPHECYQEMLCLLICYFCINK